MASTGRSSLNEPLNCLLTTRIRKYNDIADWKWTQLLDVLGERDSGVTVDGDVVVIVDGDQVAKLQVAGEGRGL